MEDKIIHNAFAWLDLCAFQLFAAHIPVDCLCQLQLASFKAKLIFVSDNKLSFVNAFLSVGGKHPVTLKEYLIRVPSVANLGAAAEQLIMGIPEADAQGFIHYGENLTIPYVGVGFICRYMEDGVTSYVPYILTKCRFVTPGVDAQTATETIEWQTQEITATLLRDDTQNHDWKLVGTEQTTEALAEAKIKAIFNIT